MTLLMAGFLCPLWSEEIVNARSLVLFKFSSGETGLPPALWAETEAGMRTILSERGGLAIRLLDMALTLPERDRLFEKIKEWEAGTLPTSNDVSLGEKTMPASDFKALTEADFIIIPTVSEYRKDEEKKDAGNGRFKVTLKTDFDFIARRGEFSRQTRQVETMGYDPDAERALGDAVKTILPLFNYELDLIQELKHDISILIWENGEAFIDRGGKAGVLLGMEYAVRSPEKNETGQLVVREKGLILISEVTDEVSVGKVLYAEPDVAAGDAVEEIRRLGFEISPYAFAFIPYPLGPEMSAYVGLRFTLAKGVHTLRPFLAVETVVYPFSTYQYWFPVRPFIGAELRLYLGRLEIAALPMIGLEEWFALSPAYVSTFMGFGLRGLVQASLLVSQGIKLFIEGGYEYWFGNRQGFLAAGGITIKL